MKKATFFLPLLLLLGFFGFSQVQVGSDTNFNISQYIPLRADYKFSYSQSIYLSTELNATGTVTSIQWYYTNSTPTDLANSQDLTVYIGTTSKTSFASATDWITSGLTQVYTGGITTNTTSGWKTITLTTPFVYDGVSNLVIAVDKNGAGNDNFNDKFRTLATTEARTISQYSATINIDPTSPTAASNTRTFIPNIIFGGLTQGCPIPNNLVASNIGTTTATVSWDALATAPADGVDYYYSTTNTAPTDSTPISGNQLTGNSANLSGLNSGSTYYVWVKSNCDHITSSPWSISTSFKTNCAAVTSLNENFDNATRPGLPACWKFIQNGGGVTPATTAVITSSAYSNTAPNSLQLSNYGSQGTYNIIAVSPALSNLGATTYQLRLQAKNSSSTNCTLEIGTLDGNSNTANFNFISAISDLTSNFQGYVINFSLYTGTDQYIGLRITGDQQSVINIDDFVWQLIPNCSDVTQVNVYETSYDGATIGWQSEASHQSWDIAYGPATITDPNTATIKNTTDDGAYQITGLDGSTTYKAWVRSDCGGSNGKGSWIGPYSFTTTCPLAAEFSENFDSISTATGQTTQLPLCWSKIKRANSGTLVTGTEIFTTPLTKATSAPNVVLLKNNGSTGDFDLILVTQALSTLTTKDHRLKFSNYYSGQGGTVEIGTVDKISNSAKFTLFTTVQFVVNIQKEYIVNFDSYKGTDHYIAIRYPNGMGLFGGFSLDNIIWEKTPACQEVNDLNITETTENEVTFEWTPTFPNNESTYDFVIGKSTDMDPNTLPSTNVATLSTSIGGLDSSTDYKLWVRAVCGGTSGNGAWVGPVFFRTECPPAMTISENFDEIPIPTGTNSTPQLPSCWSTIIRPNAGYLGSNGTITTGTISWVNTLTSFSPPNYADIHQNYPSPDADYILVTPNIDKSTFFMPYRLRFSARAGGAGGTVDIGIVTGNTINSDFIVFKTVTVNSGGQEIIVDFSNYSQEVRESSHIGFRPHPEDTPEIFIDNVNWEPIPACAEVTNLTMPLKTTTSATFAWTGDAGSTSYEVIYGVPPSSPSSLTPIPVATTSYLATNLTANTAYSYWVRSICSAGTGAWVGPYNFTTPCEAVNLPYSENFNEVNLPDSSTIYLPTCTSSINAGTSSSQWNTINQAGAYNFDTKVLRCPNNGDGIANAWFFTPALKLSQGVNYIISYRKGSSTLIPCGIQPNPCGLSDLKVNYGTSPTPAGMTLPIANHVQYQGDATNETFTFMPSATGEYYFGFDFYSGLGTGAVYVDDINITASLSNDTFDASNLSYYPNPVKDVMNLSYDKEISSIIVYNLLGQKVLTKTINTTTSAIDMSSLSSGTYFVKVTSDNQTKTIKIIKE